MSGFWLAEDAADVFGRIMALRDVVQGPPRGQLRLCADPLFGECFLSPLLNEFLTRHPEVRVETQLSTRRIDLLEEDFDAAFRIGPLADSPERMLRLGSAHVRYVASPSYLERNPAPETPADLSRHECLVLHYEGTGSQRWLFRHDGRDEWQTVRGRYRSNSFRSLYDAARDGHGIVASPAFYCEPDVASGLVVTVLDDWLPDFGSINLVFPEQRRLSSTLRRSSTLPPRGSCASDSVNACVNQHLLAGEKTDDSLAETR